MPGKVAIGGRDANVAVADETEGYPMAMPDSNNQPSPFANVQVPWTPRRIIGIVLISLAFLAFINGNTPPPDADPAYQLGQHLGPFIMMGGGWWLAFSKKAGGLK
jgi:hypothetical protein